MRSCAAAVHSIAYFAGGCAVGPPAQPHERPDLGIAGDSSQRASISLRQIRVQNHGSVSGEGVVSITVVDSLGTALMEVSLNDGAPVRVPAAGLGGAEGRVLSISHLAVFTKLVDSLVVAESRFGVRARIRTKGVDADESDNVRTREWGAWISMAPGDDLTVRFTGAVSHHPAAKLRIEPLRVPPGARVVAVSPRDGGYLLPGHHTIEIRLRTPHELEHGSVFAARVVLTDSVTGEVLLQQERIAFYDTVPPMLSSYRAVLLRDARVAVQVQAGDRHAGVSESAVATRYSLDGGRTWRRQVTRSSKTISDDRRFSRASSVLSRRELIC